MPSPATKPLIGITCGDPAGIGPEVIAKSLGTRTFRSLARYLILGDPRILKNAGLVPRTNIEIVNPFTGSLQKTRPGHPDRNSARAAMSYLQKAVVLLKKGDITSLVTAPVCKETLSALGKKFHGHTEFLARSFHVKDYEMLFVTPTLKIITVTRHIPLNSVSRNINSEKIYTAIRLGQAFLKRYFREHRPHIAVCGLNPHAGEGGNIGQEEISKIIPAIRKARRQGIHVEGPFASDTLFSPHIGSVYDLIITMYHDQGLIPVKSLCFKDLVNTTIGLPFIRTSPAHGTAFDIAGKNRAQGSSMKAAIRLAAELSSRIKTR